MSLASLNEGIFFEDVQQLLPWGASLASLRKVAKPAVRKQGDTTTLVWKSHSLFGGVLCQVDVVFSNSRYHGSRYAQIADLNALQGLSLAHLGFHTHRESKPRAQHAELRMQLTQSLGPPSHDGLGTEPFAGLPFTEWHLEHALVVLMVFERFGEYCVGEVWRKPLPAWRAGGAGSRSA